MDHYGSCALRSGAASDHHQIQIPGLAEGMKDIGMPVVIFGFLASSVIRISQGSGTVAMVTGATLTAPILETMDASPSLAALTVIAVACGGTAWSRVNDSGFWMANRYLGMSVADTLKVWTTMKTLVGLTGLGVVLILVPIVVGGRVLSPVAGCC
ncbi:hypothetical protein HGQ17_06030 [Nesterenkonia sp. MY13]|uniref:GntP family permease n=2 Tax=Nesterenkonia sedimenti TaxID=1463632 RepID=A0A7X8TJ05_9MICC|nr:hypothetical protein [Nesterenkonia sedimenti]